jgi:hypothetical protein
MLVLILSFSLGAVGQFWLPKSYVTTIFSTTHILINLGTSIHPANTSHINLSLDHTTLGEKFGISASSMLPFVPGYKQGNPTDISELLSVSAPNARDILVARTFLHLGRRFCALLCAELNPWRCEKRKNSVRESLPGQKSKTKLQDIRPWHASWSSLQLEMLRKMDICRISKPSLPCDLGGIKSHGKTWTTGQII